MIRRAHDVSLGVGVRLAGGRLPSPHRPFVQPPTFAYYTPWGFTYSSGRFSFGFSFPCRGWWSPRYTWWWPTYVSCWYPYWYGWWNSYPSYSPWYSPSYSTVVYRTVYAEEPAPGEVVESTEIVDPVVEGVEEPARIVEPQKTIGMAAERYLVLGDRAFREGRYTDAVQFYAKAVELDPGEGALYLVLADALFAAGDYHYAAYAIRRALKLDPALAEAVVDKHGFYGDPGSFDEQLAVLERYLAEHVTDRDARLALALNYLFGRRESDAVRVLTSREAAGLEEDPAARILLSSARRLEEEARAQND